MSVDVVLQGILTDWRLDAMVRILGFALFAFVTTMGIAFVYRGVSTREIPIGPSVLTGISIVAVSLNLQAILDGTVIRSTAIDHYATASYLLGVFFVGAIAAAVGRRVGDYFACDVYGITRVSVTGEVARLVQSAGLVVTHELPEEVHDLDGYRPADEATRQSLAGRTVKFPHRLDPEEVQSRLVDRVERDFDVDRVHVDLSEDDGVESIAVGRRATGLGPALAPGTAAVAIESDPSPDASTGDPVEVWTNDDGANRLVATGTFRSNHGDVATVVVEQNDVEAFEEDGGYRIVTRPDKVNDVDELVSVVWDSEETVTTVSVSEGGRLQGEFVGWLPVSVLVIDRDGQPIALPGENETLQAGDTVYVVGGPDGLDRLSEYDHGAETGHSPPTPDEAPAAGD